MATPEAEDAESADPSVDPAAPVAGIRDQQPNGSSGASSPSAVTSGDPTPASLNPVGSQATDASPEAANGMDEFQRLQRRLQLITLCLSGGALLITVLVFDRSTALSVAIGAIGALLYLRLLARSVSRLGDNSRSVGKVQLLVPIVLVLAASRLPQLSILPVFLGFLLYKPAVIIQALTDA